jgi:hypothetical protein
MTFQVELTPIAEAQIDRTGLAVEHEIFPEEVRQHLHGKSKNVYRVLFVIRDAKVYVLYVWHSSQSPLTIEDPENKE